ncbi:hypothetical protein Emag_000251 [Eimeria magna]
MVAATAITAGDRLLQLQQQQQPHFRHLPQGNGRASGVETLRCTDTSNASKRHESSTSSSNSNQNCSSTRQPSACIKALATYRTATGSSSNRKQQQQEVAPAGSSSSRK